MNRVMGFESMSADFAHVKNASKGSPCMLCGVHIRWQSIYSLDANFVIYFNFQNYSSIYLFIYLLLLYLLLLAFSIFLQGVDLNDLILYVLLTATGQLSQPYISMKVEIGIV